MIDQFRNEIGLEADSEWIANKKGTEKLMALDALKKHGM
jgi:hypothetical protein